MKQFLAFIFLSVGATTLFAQNPVIIEQNLPDSATIEQNSPKVYTIVEKMPQFVGGQEGLYKYLQEHLIYPKKAVEQGIQGKVFCQFVVDEEGYVRDVVVLRSVNPLLDAEALRVIKAMPKWEPGTQNEKTVKVYFNLPISFSLH